MEMLIGLSLYAFPHEYDIPLYQSVRPWFPLISAAFTAGGVSVMLSTRYALPAWQRRVLLAAAASPLAALGVFLAAAGLWTGTAGFWAVALAVALVPWLPGETDAAAAPDLYALVLGVGGGVAGLILLLHPEPLNPVSYLPIHGWMAVAGSLGLMGAAALLAPWSGGGWAQPRFLTQRLLGAALPLLLVYNFWLTRTWTGVLIWGTCALGLLAGEEAEPGAGTTGDRSAGLLTPAASGIAPSRLLQVERMAEAWTWLLALAMALVLLLSGAGHLIPPLTVSLFVVAVGTYNVLSTWGLPRWLGPDRRLLSHLAFLTLSVGLLLTSSGPVSHTFLVLLVVLPPLAAEVLGPATGRGLLTLALATVMVAEAAHWLAGDHTLRMFLAEAGLKVLVLALAAELGLRRVLTARRLLQALSLSEQRLSSVLHLAADAVVAFDRSRRILLFNRAAEEMFGLRAQEALGQPLATLFHGGDTPPGLWEAGGPPGTVSAIGRRPAIGTVRVRRRRGGELLAGVSLARLKLAGADVFTAIFRDVTEQQAMQAALAEANDTLSALVMASPLAISATDARGRVSIWNPAAERIYGWTQAEALGQPWPVPGAEAADEVQALQAQLRRGEVLTNVELRLERRDGTPLAVSLSAAPLFDAAGQVRGMMSVAADVTAQRQLADRMWRLANYDPLTSLFNRRRFQAELERELGRARRDQTALALLFLDLDGFKVINDTYGHDCGDEVLKQTTRLVQGWLRESDLVARQGGDEFVCLLPRTDAAEALRVADRVLTAIEQAALSCSGQPVRIRGSIGVAIYPTAAKTADRLLSLADAAMYAAKRSGGRIRLAGAGDPPAEAEDSPPAS